MNRSELVNQMYSNIDVGVNPTVKIAYHDESGLVIADVKLVAKGSTDGEPLTVLFAYDPLSGASARDMRAMSGASATPHEIFKMVNDAVDEGSLEAEGVAQE